MTKPNNPNTPKVDWDRNYKRYTIVNVEGLTAGVTNRTDFGQLVSLSNGGCGFTSMKDQAFEEFNTLKQSLASLGTKPAKRFNLKFHFEGVLNEPILVQANFVSATKKSLEDITVYYYAFQFIPADESKVRPIIDRLEELHTSGKLKTH